MAVASASRGGHLLFDKVAAMSLAFSRSAFPRGWVAVLLFATAPVSQTTVRAHTEMMPLSLQQHVHHSHGDSVVDKKTQHHTAPEKTKQSSPEKTPRENAPQKTQPATAPVTSSSVTAAGTTSPTTATISYRRVKGFRVQVYTGFADRASRNAALQVEKDIRRRFPEISTYVHFIAPRWICRVGNFVRREDAAHFARLIRAARLSSEAAVVACPILIRQHTTLPK